MVLGGGRWTQLIRSGGMIGYERIDLIVRVIQLYAADRLSEVIQP